MNSTVIPPRVKKLVATRAGWACESCGSTRDLQYAHLEHRRIGGRKNEWIGIYNDPRNIALLCATEHSMMHGTLECTTLIENLKNKLGWYDWANEYKIYYEERI